MDVDAEKAKLKEAPSEITGAGEAHSELRVNFLEDVSALERKSKLLQNTDSEFVAEKNAV